MEGGDALSVSHYAHYFTIVNTIIVIVEIIKVRMFTEIICDAYNKY